MTILIFHQYFSTNKGSYGTRLYEFARTWQKRGHKIKIVTSVYYKSDIKQEKNGRRIFVDGMEVIILNIPVSNKDNDIKRMYYFLKYSILSSFYAIKEEYDIALFSSGPITTGIPALFAKFIKRKPLVFEVRDLWPGVVEEIGVITNRFILGASYFFESILYKISNLIVTLSPGMEKNIKNRFKNVNVITITNCANLDLFHPQKKSEDSDKYAIYTGNIGRVNNSELILNAAKVLMNKNRSDVKILMVGDGQLYLNLLGKVKMEGLTNLKVKRSVPKDKLIEYLKNAFVSIVPLMDVEILDTSSPNKLFESFALGIPVIQTTNGWIKELIDKNQVGKTIDPKSPEELANVLIELHDNNKLVSQMGINCRSLAESQFDSIKLATEMIVEIEKQL